MLIRFIVTVSLILMSVACHAQDGEPEQTVDDNPVPFTISNIGRGKQLFARHCVSCHGSDGKGSTAYREFLKTPPADLSDDQWIYGDEDAQIFDVIKSGRMERDMPSFSEDLSEERIWNIVNYLKYLGGARP